MAWPSKQGLARRVEHSHWSRSVERLCSDWSGSRCYILRQIFSFDVIPLGCVLFTSLPASCLQNVSNISAVTPVRTNKPPCLVLVAISWVRIGALEIFSVTALELRDSHVAGRERIYWGWDHQMADSSAYREGKFLDERGVGKERGVWGRES